MASFEVEVERLLTNIERYQLEPQKVTAAMIAAVNKTARAAFTFMGRDIAKDTRVATALIRQRMRLWEMAPRSDKNYALISILAYSMPAILLGSPRKTAGGVNVGGRYYPHAFEAFAARRRGKSRPFIFRRGGADRYPLFEERIYLWDSIDRAMSEQRADAAGRILRNFESELKLRAGLFDK